MIASILLSFVRACGPGSGPAPASGVGRTRQGRGPRALQPGGVGAEEVGEPQAADLLHLAQGGAQLLRGRAVQPALQLAGHGLPVAEARGQHEGEAEARSVPGVELSQPEPLFQAQARQARAALLSLRLGRERAPLQLAARQVRVAAQDALLACGEAQTRGGSASREARPGGRDYRRPRPEEAPGGGPGSRERVRGKKECPGGAGASSAPAPQTGPESCAPPSPLPLASARTQERGGKRQICPLRPWGKKSGGGEAAGTRNL